MSGLSETQTKVLEYIRTNPGTTSNLVADAIGRPRKDAAAILANFMNAKTTRGMLTRNGKGGEHDPFRYWLSNGAAGNAPAVKTRRRRARQKTDALDLLITVKIGKRETITITVEEARDLMTQLLSLQRYFGASS